VVIAPGSGAVSRDSDTVFHGARVNNAVLGEFIARSRAVKSDPAWQQARQLPRRTKEERAARREAFDAVAQAYGFTGRAAQSFASSLRQSWVRDHLPAQETQNLGARAFDAVQQWHLRRRGKPRFKSTKRGLHSLSAKDGKQLVCDGYPTRHPVGDGQVSFDLGPSEIAVAVERSDGTWTGWIEPLADRVRLDTVRLRRAQRHLDRQHRTGSPGCFNADGTHRPGRCDWRRSRTAQRTIADMAEQHRRLAEHRKTFHGALANRLFAQGANVAREKLDYVAWQKNFPRSVRDRAPGLLVQTMRRKPDSAGGDRLYEYNPNITALSQTCLCGNRKKKPLSQRVHRRECGIKEDRDLFSAYLGLHVHRQADGLDRLDLEAANHGWLLRRQDVDGRRGPVVASSNRRGRRHPPSRRSVARIKARRALKRLSRSARTSTANRPTALPV
jgi:hypothetical protein